MASIISVDTLQDSAGSNEITTANVKTAFDNSAKAWADATGSGTVSVDGSFNISSMDDDGVGDYSFNFTSAFANTTYCPQATGRGDASGEGSWCTSTRTPTTTSCDIAYFHNDTGVYLDQTKLSWSALGELA